MSGNFNTIIIVHMIWLTFSCIISLQTVDIMITLLTIIGTGDQELVLSLLCIICVAYKISDLSISLNVIPYVKYIISVLMSVLLTGNKKHVVLSVWLWKNMLNVETKNLGITLLKENF